MFFFNNIILKKLKRLFSKVIYYIIIYFSKENITKLIKKNHDKDHDSITEFFLKMEKIKRGILLTIEIKI